MENTTSNNHLKLWIKISFHSCFLKPHLDDLSFVFTVQEHVLILRRCVSKHLEVRRQVCISPWT